MLVSGGNMTPGSALPHWLGITWITDKIAGHHEELLPRLHHQRLLLLSCPLRLFYAAQVIAMSQGCSTWYHESVLLFFLLLWGGPRAALGGMVFLHIHTLNPLREAKAVSAWRRPWKPLNTGLLPRLASLLFYTIQDHLPKCVTAPIELGPLTSI